MKRERGGGDGFSCSLSPISSPVICNPTHTSTKRESVCVCVLVSECERESLCEWVSERVRVRERVCVSEWEWERDAVSNDICIVKTKSEANPLAVKKGWVKKFPLVEEMMQKSTN